MRHRSVSAFEIFMWLALAVFLVLLNSCRLTAGEPPSVLRVWTAPRNPQTGLSGCGPCNRLWDDWAEDRGGIQTTLRDAGIDVRVFESHPNPLIGLPSVPFFQLQAGHAPPTTVIGYTSPEDLLARLGIAGRPADADPSPPSDASLATSSDVASLAEELARLAFEQQVHHERITELIEWVNADRTAEDLLDIREQLGQVPAAGHVEELASRTVEQGTLLESLSARIESVSDSPVGRIALTGGQLALIAATGASGGSLVALIPAVLGGLRRIRERRRPGAGNRRTLTRRDSDDSLTEHYRLHIDRLEAERNQLQDELRKVADDLQTVTAGPEKTETRFVHVPVTDGEGEAYKEAVRRVAELQPSAVGLMNQVESTARQILHGRRVNQRGDAPRESKPGLWSDGSQPA